MKKLSIILALATILTATALFTGCKNDADTETNSSVASEAVSETASEETSETASEESSEAVSEESSEAASEESSEAVSEEVSDTAPEGYKTFKNSDISFVYPESWAVQDGEMVLILDDKGTGNNIAVVSEPLNKIYQTIDAATFEQLMAPTLSASGMAISGTTVEQVKNEKGTEITKIFFVTTYLGINMNQTLLCVNAGSLTYSVTFTEVAENAEALEALFNSLTVVA